MTAACSSKHMGQMDEEDCPVKAEKILNTNEFSIEESSIAIRENYFKTGKYYEHSYVKDFEKWNRVLEHRLNLCLFGMGSKTRVVEEFLKRYQTDVIQLRIKGYHSSVKVDNILMKMLQVLELFSGQDLKAKVVQLLGFKRHQNAQTIDLLVKLLNNLEQFNLSLLIIFLDIDGKNFREIESHKLLSKVFDHKAVRLLATFSNMNFMYLLNQDVIQSYNFCYLPVHTFEPNEAELVADEMCWFNTKMSKGTDSIKAIYGALTETQREILKLLATKISSSSNHQITFTDLFEYCLDEMLISSEHQLFECLKEPIAHNVQETYPDRDRKVWRGRSEAFEDAKRNRGLPDLQQ